MCKFRVLLLCFAVVAVHFNHINCLYDEDKKVLRDGLESIAHDCLHGCGIDETEIENIEADDNVDQCFKKCIMTDAGFLDQDGKYNKDILNESLNKVIGNQDNAERILNELDHCFSENGDNTEVDEEAHMKRIDVLFACLRQIRE
ncbi:uncharacterized protein LOC118267991 [Spodoptera frugiperda]|uniref:Uncharacterized protein LOC118267991 n=1 Tax=Spodoptera frugiperda TaxID=7108 RepID=A0A9R0EUI7_SPOFR|nr:uncharacterized protein LOC118267991 [Spodoptera frugiperda]